MSELNDRQTEFCRQYLIDLNATKAAKRAGYSEATAGSQGFDLLKKPEIQDLISKFQEERAKRTEVTSDRVLLELARMGFSNIKDFVDEQDEVRMIHELDDNQSACISEIHDTITTVDGVATRKRKIKLYDKPSALEKIARHLGFFKEDNDQTGKVIEVTFGKK